jgi:hypothetical protein
MKLYDGKENSPDKTVLSAILSNAILIEKVQGTSVSAFSLKEKVDLVMNDPKFSLSMFERVNREFDNIKFGVNEEVRIVSPVTKESIIRRFQFRLVDILSALILYESDGYVVRFE